MKRFLKRLSAWPLLISCLIIFSILLFRADRTISENTKTRISPPLQLFFDATYAGGKIAEIEFTESNPYQYEGIRVREIECRIESSGMFDINGLYRSIIAEDYSLVYFKSDEGQSGNKKITEYRFDYPKRSAIVTRIRVSGPDSSRTTKEIKNIDKRYFDALSMILRLRDNFDTLTVPIFIPVFMKQKQDSILIESIKDVRISGQDGGLVDAALIRGKLPYSPFPGFGNRIELYISKDEKRAPLGGRIQMALGYIEINLRNK